MLHDHYHELSEVITEGLLSPEGFNGVSLPRLTLPCSGNLTSRDLDFQSAIAPSPKSNVINGRGLYNCSFAATGQTCNQLTQSDLPELRFPPNKRVRLRFIHEGSHRERSSYGIAWSEAEDLRTPQRRSKSRSMSTSSMPLVRLQSGSFFFRGDLRLTSLPSSRRGRRHASPCPAGPPHPDREYFAVASRAKEERPSHAQLAGSTMQATAQRYSGLLYTTGHRTGDSFYLRSQMNTDCLGQSCLCLPEQGVLFVA